MKKSLQLWSSRRTMKSEQRNCAIKFISRDFSVPIQSARHPPIYRCLTLYLSSLLITFPNYIRVSATAGAVVVEIRYTNSESDISDRQGEEERNNRA